jgi:FAD-dependent urate hydroxylase
MRILIVGGGIAGLTLAGLLRQRGIEPVVVEKAKHYDNVGYFLSLWPLGSRILWGLGLYQQYADAGTSVNEYSVYDFKGKLLRSYALGDAMKAYGEMYIISRAKLLDVLLQGIDSLPVRLGTTVSTIRQSTDEVFVEFTDGSKEVFDLVVGADGLHSRVRELVFGHVPLTSTGWGGWMWWTDTHNNFPGAAEYWGVGCFAGVGQVDNRTGTVIAMPIDDDLDVLRVEPLDYIHQKLGQILPSELAGLLETLDHEKTPTFIRLEDLKMPQWYKGRVVLIGDASAGFLPTAGVGASMAMESAAVLNDELLRVDTQHIPHALQMFVKRRQKRVDAIQNESRWLARVMFTQSQLVALGRRLLLYYYVRPEQLFRQISSRMEEPI